MPSFRKLAVSIAILFIGGGTAVASDDNPWRVEAPGEREQRKLLERFDREFDRPIWGQSQTGRSTGQTGFDLDRSRLPSAAKGSELGAGQNGIFKNRPMEQSIGNAEGRKRQGVEYYGYAGSKQALPVPGRGPTGHSSGFGAFPPLDDNDVRKTKPKGQGRVQFKGQTFGSFAPLEKRIGKRIQRDYGRDGRRLHKPYGPQANRPAKRSEFSNVLPPPVPDPAPDHFYPDRRYGGPTGFPVDPGMMGLFVPGF